MMTICLSPAAVDAILSDACRTALTGEAPVIQSQMYTKLRLDQLARDHQSTGALICIAFPSPAGVDAILRDTCCGDPIEAAPVIQSHPLARRPPGELFTVEVLPDSDVAVITPTRAGARHAARLFYDAQPKALTAYVWRAQGGQRGLRWQTQEQMRAWLRGDEPPPWGDVCGRILMVAPSRRAYVSYIEALYERASASIQPE